ncbi:hypothetical protein B6U99_04120 [Candidatus Geothermarchaeota archaeon ex4572_27]|nr:MAG: hypothetical protein B6U99_04120 [Candidatus Geothermarchaeota archaeon ex4572_27]
MSSVNRTGYECHIAYIEANKEHIEKGEPILIAVSDLENWTTVAVKALVSDKAEGPEWKDLWLRDREDKVIPTPMKIKVLEVLDEEELVRLQRPGSEKEVVGASIYGTAIQTEKMKQLTLDRRKKWELIDKRVKEREKL